MKAPGTRTGALCVKRVKASDREDRSRLEATSTRLAAVSLGCVAVYKFSLPHSHIKEIRFRLGEGGTGKRSPIHLQSSIPTTNG